jgi:hypothetical protein
MATEAINPHPGYRFQGRYTQADLDALAQFTVSQLLDQRIGRATMSATLLLAIGALLSRSWLIAIGGFAVILGVSVLVRYVILPRRLLRHARQIPGLSGDRIITIEGQELRHQAEGCEQTFQRKAIRRLALHKAHLFILLKPRGCLMLPLAWIQAPATIDRVIKCLVPHEDD